MTRDRPGGYMKLQILGSGCAKCQALANNAKEAIEKAGLEAEIEKITDIDTILEMGVMMTPGIAIDGVVKKTGKVLSVDEIAALVKEYR
jgi:small redox-active disulfide protein 2